MSFHHLYASPMKWAPQWFHIWDSFLLCLFKLVSSSRHLCPREACLGFYSGQCSKSTLFLPMASQDNLAQWWWWWWRRRKCESANINRWVRVLLLIHARLKMRQISQSNTANWNSRDPSFQLIAECWKKRKKCVCLKKEPVSVLVLLILIQQILRDLKCWNFWLADINAQMCQQLIIFLAHLLRMEFPSLSGRVLLLTNNKKSGFCKALPKCSDKLRQITNSSRET